MRKEQDFTWKNFLPAGLWNKRVVLYNSEPRHHSVWVFSFLKFLWVKINNSWLFFELREVNFKHTFSYYMVLGKRGKQKETTHSQITHLLVLHNCLFSFSKEKSLKVLLQILTEGLKCLPITTKHSLKVAVSLNWNTVQSILYPIHTCWVKIGGYVAGTDFEMNGLVGVLRPKYEKSGWNMYRFHS